MRSEKLLWQPKVAGGWSETARSYHSAGCRRWRVAVNGQQGTVAGTRSLTGECR